MGSCISKCIPKSSSFQEVEDGDHVVHVKHAITPAEKPVSSSPSSASITSLSSFSCSSTANSGCSLTSSLSSSSSCSSKDRSFSNEFLRSCAQENQHLIVLKPNKGSLERPNVRQRQKLRPSPSSPIVMPLKPSSPRMQVSGSTPKKRARGNSPTLVRQKSFRKDPESVPTSTCHFPNRALRSPSPSRRFTTDGQGKTENSTFRRDGVFKGNIVNSASSGVRKENFKPSSPNYQPRRVDNCSKGNIVNSKTDEGGTEGVQSSQEMDAMLIEDLNNPLIALDCFIFL